MRIEIFKVGTYYGAREVYLFGLRKSGYWIDLREGLFQTWGCDEHKAKYCLGELKAVENSAIVHLSMQSPNVVGRVMRKGQEFLTFLKNNA